MIARSITVSNYLFVEEAIFYITSYMVTGITRALEPASFVWEGSV